MHSSSFALVKEDECISEETRLLFDYKGFSKETLANICNPDNAYRGLNKHVYKCSEMYSIGRCLRAYADYPSWMSLYVYASHGGVNRNAGFPHEVDNDAPAMLVYNEEARRNYRLKSDKPCYLVTMPYVWYRRQRGYHKLDSARGTLAYPYHSTDQLESHFDVLKYIEELKALPHVYSVSFEDGLLSIQCEKSGSNLLRVLNYLQGNDIPFGRVDSKLPTLNDVFLEITGRELRDGGEME